MSSSMSNRSRLLAERGSSPACKAHQIQSAFCIPDCLQCSAESTAALCSHICFCRGIYTTFHQSNVSYLCIGSSTDSSEVVQSKKGFTILVTDLLQLASKRCNPCKVVVDFGDDASSYIVEHCWQALGCFDCGLEAMTQCLQYTVACLCQHKRRYAAA